MPEGESSDIDHKEDVDTDIIIKADLDIEGVGPLTNEPKKYLPPGSIHEQWKQYNAVEAPGCDFVTFWRVWMKEFYEQLGFGRSRQHVICSICTKHKTALKLLASNLQGFHRQSLLYQRHLRSQHLDRQHYWHNRALSRSICMV